MGVLATWGKGLCYALGGYKFMSTVISYNCVFIANKLSFSISYAPKTSLHSVLLCQR